MSDVDLEILISDRFQTLMDGLDPAVLSEVESELSACKADALSAENSTKKVPMALFDIMKVRDAMTNTAVKAEVDNIIAIIKLVAEDIGYPVESYSNEAYNLWLSN